MVIAARRINPADAQRHERPPVPQRHAGVDQRRLDQRMQRAFCRAGRSDKDTGSSCSSWQARRRSPAPAQPAPLRVRHRNGITYDGDPHRHEVFSRRAPVPPPHPAVGSRRAQSPHPQPCRRARHPGSDAAPAAARSRHCHRGSGMSPTRRSRSRRRCSPYPARGPGSRFRPLKPGKSNAQTSSAPTASIPMPHSPMCHRLEERQHARIGADDLDQVVAITDPGEPGLLLVGGQPRQEILIGVMDPRNPGSHGRRKRRIRQALSPVPNRRVRRSGHPRRTSRGRGTRHAAAPATCRSPARRNRASKVPGSMPNRFSSPAATTL